MTTPRTTILICSHNGARTIGAAIESALAQISGFEFEVVVVDDGSTDGTGEIVSGYIRQEKGPGKHITLMRMQENKGLSFACNEGLKVARGEYFTRLDDDDLFSEDAVASMCAPLVSGEAEWSYCDRLVVDTKTGLANRFDVGPASGDAWLSRLSACGVMMRRDIVISMGGYRPIFWHEYDLYMRYLELTGNFPHYVPRAVYVCGGHTGVPSIADSKMWKGWEELARIWGERKLRQHGFAEFAEFSGSGDAA